MYFQCGEWIRVRVHQMEPDLMEVGSTLEEALQLQQEHDQLLSKLQVSYLPFLKTKRERDLSSVSLVLSYFLLLDRSQ